MLSFENDYSNGAHEMVLKRLMETNRESLAAYGCDPYSASAAEKIRALCGAPSAEVFFLTGGTQTNQTVISAMLASYEGVVAADSGHINLHEAGAVESTGHKVLALPHRQGKLPPETLEQYLSAFYADENHAHMVFPGMVYISHPTEYGTLYTKQELTALAKICREYQISLYLDGARLGYGLMSDGTDVTLPDIAKCCDVFYIGGTKIGALCGEAVAFPKGNTPPHFMTFVKQRGALLAKGRLLGVQFDALFTDDLYFKISKNAVDRADELRNAFRQKGYSFFLDTPTNQIFIVLENAKMEALRKQVSFSFWERLDENHTVVRFATSWATEPQEVQDLIALL